MKEVKKTVDLFIASDGKEFLDRESCKKYENETLSYLERTKYFRVNSRRDLNETGLFYQADYVAVYLCSRDYCHHSVVLQHLVDINQGKVIGVNVQGYGVASLFEITEISREQYLEAKPVVWGGTKGTSNQIFISEVEVDGFPKPIKVLSKHIPNLK